MHIPAEPWDGDDKSAEGEPEDKNRIVHVLCLVDVIHWKIHQKRFSGVVFHLSGDDVDGGWEDGDGQGPQDPREVLLWRLALGQVEPAEVGDQGVDWNLKK